MKSCTVGAVGEWQNITPPGLRYGNAFVIDPKNTATIYATGGNEGGGRQKSTDCGSTWSRINTGRNASLLDKDGSWTMVIDPVDTNVLYANINYGAMGLFKSTNGGVDWDSILSTEASKALQYGGFVEHIAIDPTNHLHLRSRPTFHARTDTILTVWLKPRTVEPPGASSRALLRWVRVAGRSW